MWKQDQAQTMRRKTAKVIIIESQIVPISFSHVPANVPSHSTAIFDFDQPFAEEAGVQRPPLRNRCQFLGRRHHRHLHHSRLFDCRTYPPWIPRFLWPLGRYLNDVCTRRGRGSPKEDERKGGCVILTVTRCQKIRLFCRRHFSIAPKENKPQSNHLLRQRNGAPTPT